MPELAPGGACLWSKPRVNRGLQGSPALIWILSALLSATDFHGEVLGPNPFCSKLLTSLTQSSDQPLTPKHLAQVLPQLVRPEHGLEVGSSFRNHDFQIAELFEMWVRRQGRGKEAPWIRDHRQLRSLFNKFVKEQDRVFKRLLPRLVEILPSVIQSKTKVLLNSEFAEINQQKYEFIRLLEERELSKIHLTRKDQELFLVKQILGDTSVFERQRKTFEFLSSQNAMSSKILMVDEPSQRIVLSFHAGLSIEDIQDLVDREILPLQILEAFSFQHARFYNSLMQKLRTPYLMFFEAGPVALDPNIARVVFDPGQNQWLVVDPF